MNKFSKICVGTLCAIVGVGAVGGICYQEIPAFKTILQTNKIFCSISFL